MPDEVKVAQARYASATRFHPELAERLRRDWLAARAEDAVRAMAADGLDLPTRARLAELLLSETAA